MDSAKSVGEIFKRAGEAYNKLGDRVLLLHPAAQELISRHGGLIEFESRPGRTVFQVLVPLDDAGDSRG